MGREQSCIDILIRLIQWSHILFHQPGYQTPTSNFLVSSQLQNSELFHEGDFYIRLPCGARYSQSWMTLFLPRDLVNEMKKLYSALQYNHTSQLLKKVLCAVCLTEEGECIYSYKLYAVGKNVTLGRTNYVSFMIRGRLQNTQQRITKAEKSLLVSLQNSAIPLICKYAEV